MDDAWLRRLARTVPGAREAGRFFFLADPAWGQTERKALETALDTAAKLGQLSAEGQRNGWLCIPTGGTSGLLRFARHDERTIAAAIEGYQRHFQLEKVNATGVLPLHHVSGFMAAARCAYTGGNYTAMDWRSLQNAACSNLRVPEEGSVLSLVPTQLQRLLAVREGADWLRRFQVVHLGGGPMWPQLGDTAAAAGIRVALGYGMTETAAMAVSQRPEDFARGERDAGRPMPHAMIELQGGEDGEGVIGVRSASLFRGYFPNTREGETFCTEDLGEWSERGTLRVLGRRDAVLITGGEKVWPEEVEAALRATGVFADVAVLGVPDARWGQEVVACFSGPAELLADQQRLIEEGLDQALARFKHPKRYVRVEPWPVSAQGKVNRKQLLESVRCRQRP